MTALPSTELTGMTVLVVEDDFFIASDTIDMLVTAGAATVGPFGWVEEALAAASNPDVALDFAILDVDLHGARTYQVADALTKRGVPFVFASGFGSDALGPAYRHHTRLEKPVNERALLALIHAAR